MLSEKAVSPKASQCKGSIHLKNVGCTDECEFLGTQERKISAVSEMFACVPSYNSVNSGGQEYCCYSMKYFCDSSPNCLSSKALASVMCRYMHFIVDGRN